MIESGDGLLCGVSGCDGRAAKRDLEWKWSWLDLWLLNPRGGEGGSSISSGAFMSAVAAIAQEPENAKAEMF